MIEAYFDGLFKWYDQSVSWAFVVYENRKRIHAAYDTFEVTIEPTWKHFEGSQFAEYKAFVELLTWLKENGKTEDQVVVKGDSEFVLRRAVGRPTFNPEWILSHYEQSKKLMSKFKHLSFEMIAQENREADRLSKLAYAHYKRGKT